MTTRLAPTVERYLKQLPGITKVHDLHIWAMSTTETALAAHLVKPDGKLDDLLLDQTQHELHESIWNRAYDVAA